MALDRHFCRSLSIQFDGGSFDIWKSFRFGKVKIVLM